MTDTEQERDMKCKTCDIESEYDYCESCLREGEYIARRCYEMGEELKIWLARGGVIVNE